MTTKKSLSQENITRLHEMLPDLASNYYEHLTLTPDEAINNSAINPSTINTHQLIFDLLRQKMTMKEINCDLAGHSDINGTCFQLYRKWKSWKNKQ